MTTHTNRPGLACRRSLGGLRLALALAALGCSPAADTYVLEEDALEIPIALPAEIEAYRPVPVESDERGALLDLKVQVDLRRLGEMLAERRLPRKTRRRIVVAALARVAERSRADLREKLEFLRRRGAIREFRAFSVVNRIWVQGTSEAILDLARHPAVASLEWETQSEAPVWAGLVAKTGKSSPELRRASWALPVIGAEVAHRRGLDGRGLVVGIIDSGASAAHEQLRGGFLGTPRGWHDPVDRRPLPSDGAFGHGSGVLSAAVGANKNGILLGVAPGALWAACAALPDGHYNNALLTECADWMLNVAQPDILVNAWLLPDPGCDRSLVRIVNAWRAAEILPVFAVGNHGPERGRDRSPANYVDLYPGGMPALSVGGVGKEGELLPLSTPGPGSCAPGARLPALTAPAEDLITALPLTSSSYRQVDGTSFAAGLVAGAAALLLQAHPSSSVADLERALYAGAADLGATGPDDVYGHGRLDIPGALARLAEGEPQEELDGAGGLKGGESGPHPPAGRPSEGRSSSASRRPG